MSHPSSTRVRQHRPIPAQPQSELPTFHPNSDESDDAVPSQLSPSQTACRSIPAQPDSDCAVPSQFSRLRRRSSIPADVAAAPPVTAGRRAGRMDVSADGAESDGPPPLSSGAASCLLAVSVIDGMAKITRPPPAATHINACQRQIHPRRLFPLTPFSTHPGRGWGSQSWSPCRTSGRRIPILIRFMT